MKWVGNWYGKPTFQTDAVYTTVPPIASVFYFSM